MKKVNLSLSEILNKEFNVDFKGYSAAEVDAFLDKVIQDYQIYDKNIEELSTKIVNLENKLTEANNRILELNGKEKAVDNNFNSLDLLKRVSRLEQEVFKSK